MSETGFHKSTGNMILRNWSNRHSRLLEILYGAFLPVLLALGPIARVLPSKTLQKLVAPVEKIIKRALFNCQMCGNCTLTSSGMSCPMNCPKNLRNGPCGGVRHDGSCEVIPSMPCVWVKAWDGAKQMRHGSHINHVQPPLDHRVINRSSWAAVMQAKHPTGRLREDTHIEKIQPSNLKDTPPVSALQAKLETGQFCITTEFNPPDSADPDDILFGVEQLLALCDGVNITDGAGANTHISSASVAALLARDGHSPVMQVSCRDRNRIAIQADVLGASALGVRNILCLTGDGIKAEDKTGAKSVFDLDCTSLLTMLRHMRDRGEFMSGGKLAKKPELFLGATSNPCAIEPGIEVDRIAKKIEAGAQFIQTQYCFDIEVFKTFFARFHNQGLHERCHFIVGIGPLGSAKAAQWMRKNIAGVRMPDRIITRLETASDTDQEGIDICVELIKQLRELNGIAGVHVMAPRQADKVRQVIEQAELTQ